MRYAGTALMLWLAWDGWRDAGESSPTALHAARAGDHIFWFALATNILNPKAFLFYAAVLPQFLDGAGGWIAPASLALVAVAVASAIHLAIVAIATHASHWLAQPARLRRVRRILALALVGVAIWLFVSSAPPR